MFTTQMLPSQRMTIYMNLSQFPLRFYRMHTYARMHAHTPRRAVPHHIIYFKNYLFSCLSSPICDELIEESVTIVFIPRLISYIELVLSNWSFKQFLAKIIWEYYMEGQGQQRETKTFFSWILPFLSEILLASSPSHHQPPPPTTPNLPIFK